VRRRRPPDWLLVLGGLLVLGLASSARLYFGYSSFGLPGIGWRDALASGCLDWLLWAPLVPSMAWAARRYPFFRDSRGRVFARVALHAVLGVVFSIAQLVLFSAASAWLRDRAPGAGELARELRSAFLIKFHAGTLVYWAFLLGYGALDANRRRREEELARTTARLDALHAQLEPHFLFNSLNTVAGLMRSDPDRAERVLARLGDLLRVCLRERESHTVTVAEEVEFLEGYVEIQEARFGERLAVELDVDSEVRDAQVPWRLLQPLVENAIHHGLSPRPEGGRVEVRVGQQDGELSVAVVDDGVGLNGQASEGVGLANTRSRLELLYPDRYTMCVTERDEGGVACRITLPLERTGAR